MTVQVLKRRADFLKAAKSRRFNTRHFLLQIRKRGSREHPDRSPRFGYTVTKKVGGAVVRNRIRRRLKEAVRVHASKFARTGHDYVLIARRSAEHVPFRELTTELEKAILRTNATSQGRRA